MVFLSAAEGFLFHFATFGGKGLRSSAHAWELLWSVGAERGLRTHLMLHTLTEKKETCLVPSTLAAPT